MFLLCTSLGFLFVVLGLGYFLDPKAIVRLNAMMRDYFFRDSYVLLNGKRIGAWLLVLGFILLVLGSQRRLPWPF